MTVALSQAAPTTDEPPNALSQLVGQKVRQARERSNMPRRQLSEQSGVSPRYLAQLEAGEGNVSVILLQKVAQALGEPVGWFLEEHSASDDSRAALLDLFDQADAATRRRVLDLLQASVNDRRKAERICLIGLRGAGKSTLGSRAAQVLGVNFIELNAAIEALGGMPVAEIMALYGPEGYRELEYQALADIAERFPRAIVAVAGGLVGEARSFELALSRFHSIWIKAQPEEHMARVRAQGDTRPMTGNPQAMAQLRHLLSAREALYARADHQLDTSGRSVEQSLDALLALIVNAGCLSGVAG